MSYDWSMPRGKRNCENLPLSNVRSRRLPKLHTPLAAPSAPTPEVVSDVIALSEIELLQGYQDAQNYLHEASQKVLPLVCECLRRLIVETYPRATKLVLCPNAWENGTFLDVAGILSAEGIVLARESEAHDTINENMLQELLSNLGSLNGVCDCVLNLLDGSLSDL